MKLNEFVREVRLRTGKNQREFAEILDLKSSQTVTDYESGKANPSFKILTKMLNLVGLTVEECINFPSNEKKYPELTNKLHWLLDKKGTPARLAKGTIDDLFEVYRKK